MSVSLHKPWINLPSRFLQLLYQYLVPFLADSPHLNRRNRPLLNILLFQNEDRKGLQRRFWNHMLPALGFLGAAIFRYSDVPRTWTLSGADFAGDCAGQREGS